MASPTVRRSPYKDFLQAVLQRRFASAGWVVIATAYAEAVLLSRWNSWLWSWFPIGPAGLRAVFLFLCGVLVMIIRIAHYHPGLRTSDYPAQTFFRYALTWQTVETLFAYILSGLIFSQVYRWSLPEDSGLNLVTSVTSDRVRLNEQTVFFTTHFVLLGIYQALLHLFKDTDRLLLGSARKPGPDANGITEKRLQRLSDEAPSIVVATLNRSIAGLLISVVVYPVFLRTAIWRTNLAILRPFFNLPRTNMLPAALPFNLWTLLRCWGASLLLVLMWTAGNTAFSLFLARGPIKHGKPLTNESKDPNSSLLNGLKNKKFSIKCFAMWELASIARDFPDRRKTIYADSDQKEGPVWSQVYGICTEVLKSMEGRIDNYGKTSAGSSAGTATNETASEKQRTVTPPRDDNIFQKSPSSKGLRNTLENAFASQATAPGQGSQLSPVARKAAARAKEEFSNFKHAVTSPDAHGPARDLTLKALTSWAGWAFQQTVRRRVASVVLGEPYGEPTLYVNAASALGDLVVHSLKEDVYGNVQRDVASIVRTLTTVTRKLDAFVKGGVKRHWTDVEGRTETPEVDEILEGLRASLKGIVETFAPYAKDLRLSTGEMRAAREAAGVKEMREVKVKAKAVS